MNILLLTPYHDKIVQALDEIGDDYIVTMDKIDRGYVIDNSIEFIVSYGYRHIIEESVIDLLENRVVNMHISMLPESRGAHPNFWSIVNGHYSGFTIHLVDKGLDTGNILIQQEVPLEINNETFSSSYKKLSEAIERAFYLNWKYLRTGSCSGWEQIGAGSAHRAKELDCVKGFLPLGWDTPIKTFFRLYSMDTH